MATRDLTAERLRELLHYDPETGAFTWLPRTQADFGNLRAFCVWTARYANKPAGHTHKILGYVSILGFWAHRLAWLYMAGEWPKNEIDHIDGNKANNRFANLRDVDRKTNQQNIRTSWTDMPLGVNFQARKVARPYVASIHSLGKRVHLGYFDTPELAHAAYLDAKRRLHAGCTL